ncbi:MAG: diguanylate cyclase, partial [Pseudomonadota bacterium]
MIIEWMPEPEQVLEADSQETDEVSIIKAAISHMAQGLVVYNANSELVFHNAAYRAIYKLRKEDLNHSMPIAEVIELQALSLGLDAEGVAEFNSPFSQITTRSWSAIRRLPDGRSIQMSRRPMSAGYFVVTHEDITDRVKMENEIRYAANHDNLTGLANRKAFLDNLEVGLKRARRGESIALLAIDLDGFKNINDTHGHATGDRVLKLVADRIRATARDTDVASRFGGDEFSIIQLPAQDVSDAECLSARIVEALAAPFSVDGQTLMVGASVGVALADEGTKDIESLMQNADLALYRAKTDGKGCYRFFDDKLNQIMRRRRAVEARMRSAVENKQFTLYYQPIVNVESRRVESV